MELPRYFHVFNRGLDKRVIFPNDSYRRRFLLTLKLSRLSKSPYAASLKRQKAELVPKESEMEKRWGPALVNVLAFCLMPNHFHFLLKEFDQGGAAKFMQRLGNGYTKYYNARREREGRLFTSTYKQVQIETDEQLVHVSRYIHLNPHTSSSTKVSIKKLRSYPWSSLQAYLGAEKNLLCQPAEVLDFFASPEDYWQFVVAGLEDSLERFSHDLFIDSG